MLLLAILVATRKSIWSSKALIKEGLLWRVGDGRRIHIWDDPWLLDDDGRTISSASNDSVNLVHDLIDERTLGWNLDVIDGIFNERDKRCILALPLSEVGLKDELTWAFSKNGLYTVKTAICWVKVVTLMISSKLGWTF